MIYSWLKLFNLTEFNNLLLGSKTYTVFIDGIGEKDFLVTKGNLVSVTYDGVMIPIGLNDKNQREFDDMAIYLDDETQDVYVGINGREDES